MEAQMHTASQQALEAQAAARRLEADLADLSGAYNSVEAHAFEAEAQQHALQQQLAQLRSQLELATGGGVGPGGLKGRGAGRGEEAEGAGQGAGPPPPHACRLGPGAAWAAAACCPLRAA
jgi:hypothetical protein